MMTKFEELNGFIEDNNRDEVMRVLAEIKHGIDGGDVSMIEHIATPANLTKLHNDLCEKMGVIRRLLQLRGRVPNASHRASLFIQAMINAVRMSDGNKLV